MKPNFHAIGAIIYGLRFGITGIPVFLRRGWLAVLISVGAAFGLFSAIFTDAHLEILQGNLGYGMAGPFEQVFEDVIEFGGNANVEFAWDEGDQELVGQVLLFYFLQLVAVILAIPALVDLYRKSAGLETRPGFLPGFGEPEWALLFSVLLLILANFLFYALLLLPVGGLIAFGVSSEQPAAVVVAGAIAIVGLFWWAVRSSLIPIHGALLGRVSFLEGFGITGGRFWKLLGTIILMGVVVAAIAVAVSVLGVALDFTQMVGLSIGLNVLLQIYLNVALAGFYGRITGELMGLVDDAGTNPDDLRKPFADDVDDSAEAAVDGGEGLGDWSDDTADTAEAEASRDFAAAQSLSSAKPLMMQRSGHQPAASTLAGQSTDRSGPPRASVQFVRRRFRS